MAGESLQRLVEGIRLYNLLPGSRLILSGGTAFGDITSAEVMKQVALEVGVPENDILMEPDSMDTKDELDRKMTVIDLKSKTHSYCYVKKQLMF
ncbi:hypothetical protein ES703_114534 [subsurface metagenome]